MKLMTSIALTRIAKPARHSHRRGVVGVTRSPIIRMSMLATAILYLTGCASVPADLGRSEVEALVTARGQAVTAPADETGQLLASLSTAPLTPESAVRIALLNSPQLQSTYATLGFGAADVYAGGRIRNPILSGALLDSSASGDRDQVTFGLVTSFTDLITLSARKRLSRGDFAALQQSIAAEVLATAATVQRTYYEYIGAQQVAALRSQIAKAGALSAALAERYRDAGNLTPRELALERAAASATRLIALEAEAAAFAARTDLAVVLGLSVGGDWKAPAQLRLPLQVEDKLDTLLAMANESRLDLAAAHTQTEVLADRLGVVNWTRWLGELDGGVERERETDGVRLTGPTVDWELPIFNQHKDSVLRANTELQIAVNELRRISIDIDNGVRLAYAGLNIAKARIAEYRDVLIPQRIETVARAQEEVNYMLIGIFELIALKQDEYDAYEGYLDALRDYWLARADLSLATGAALPSSAQIGDQSIDVEDFIRPQTGGMDHSGHGSMEVNKQGAMDHSKHQKTQAPESVDHSGHSMKAPDKPIDPSNETHKHHDSGGSK